MYSRPEKLERLLETAQALEDVQVSVSNFTNELDFDNVNGEVSDADFELSPKSITSIHSAKYELAQILAELNALCPTVTSE